MKNWKNGKIIYCPEKYCIIVHLEHSFFFSGLALLASSFQLGHAVTFPPFCFVLADKMNGVLYRVVSVRNCCLLLQKRAYWKMLIVKMQMSENWHRKIVNQDIPFLVIPDIPFLLRSPQHLAVLQRRIELHTANNSSVHLKTLLSWSI